MKTAQLYLHRTLRKEMGVHLCGVLLVVVVMVGVSEAGPVPDMTRLVRENDINEQLDNIETLMTNVENKVDCIPRPKNMTDVTPRTPTPEPMLSASPPDDCDYASLDPKHTLLLKPNENCQSHVMGLKKPEEKDLILQLHNDLRSKVAKGEETRGSPGPQPPAANMRELVWSDKLAKVAQAWANQCPNGHDTHEQRQVCGESYKVGQNIHYYWGFDSEPNWKFGVEDWYNEVELVPNTLPSSFRLPGGPSIGHYTQMLWAETHEIGCGMVYYETTKRGSWYPESKTYVCNYGMGGNIKDWPMYKEGPAASKCPNGVSAKYPALCV